MTIQQTFSFDETDSPGETVPAALTATPIRSRPANAATLDRPALVHQLQTQIGHVTAPSSADPTFFSSGSAAIDELLPHAGLRAGSITEWLAENEACGAAALSLAVLASRFRSLAGRPAASAAGPLVVVDPAGTFYPPAAIALGIPGWRIVWCRPRNHADTVWAIDQALRCEAVAAVWARLGARLEDRDARRFQLAAETGDTSGMLIRPSSVRGQPSFAETRFHVAIPDSRSSPQVPSSIGKPSRSNAPPSQRRAAHESWPIRVTLDRCRGGTAGGSAWVAIDSRGRIQDSTPSGLGRPRPFSAEVDRHETAAVHLASRLAHPTLSRRELPSRRRA